MPIQYKHMLGGPSLKVDIHTGATAEGVLTFIISFAVLLIVLRGQSSPVIKTWLLAMATVALIVAGSSYTGPSMNPANVSIPLLLKICILHSHFMNLIRTSSKLRFSCLNLPGSILCAIDAFMIDVMRD